MNSITEIPPLYGLVLVGGKSRRMGQDKAWLRYHGKPQILYLSDLLQNFCETVYLSCRPGQRDQDARLADIPKINDKIADIGPISGIHSAQVYQPTVAWLVIACDLPLVTAESIDYLIQRRDPTKLATCFASEDHDDFPEPLCTIYEPQSGTYLGQAIKNGSRSPAKVLLHEAAKTKVISLPVPQLMRNVNDAEEYLKLTKNLRLL